eukprot:NODE_7241_length_411_cov_356.740331_g5597_i0.p4 GENE.NODE_7241_length_411_cov_356.740331_g5597_i0~~NODE_7241_length_411_cov_356.740331_g5597_i0.p4  ORF type:complete len:64 (-),score=5.90 NODE_7241_length_411_cov_356.740331_g5597_i0:57-248(-)
MCVCISYMCGVSACIYRCMCASIGVGIYIDMWVYIQRCFGCLWQYFCAERRPDDDFTFRCTDL